MDNGTIAIIMCALILLGVVIRDVLSIKEHDEIRRRLDELENK